MERGGVELPGAGVGGGDGYLYWRYRFFCFGNQYIMLLACVIHGMCNTC